MPIRLPKLPKGLASLGIFTGGRLACSAISMIGGLLLVRLVDPATLGLFNTVALVHGYIACLQFGVFNGLNRELPYCLGKGDQEKAHSMAATGQTWALLLGVLSFAALAVAAIVYACMGKGWLAAACAVNAFAGFTAFYGTSYLNVTFRTKHDFIKLSGIELFVAFCALALLGLVWWQGFYGLCARTLVCTLLTTLLLHFFRPIRVPFKWVLSEWKHLVKIGMPIYIVGQVYAWWHSTMTPTLIAWIGGAKMMGLYGFVTFVSSAAAIISMSACQVYYPRMVEAYAKNGDPRMLMSMLRRPILLLTGLYVVLGALGWFALPVAIRLLAPNYHEAIFPTQLSMLLCPFLGVYPIFLVFNVIKKQQAYLRCIIGGAMVNVLVLAILLHYSTDLTSYILASLAGKIAFFAASFFTLRYITSNLPPAPHP
jgi:O-antigen/teichoic acid export membrane protein